MSSTQSPTPCRYCKSELRSPLARVCHECGNFQHAGDQLRTAILKPANLLSLLAVVLAFWQANAARSKAADADRALSDAWNVYDSVEASRKETLRYAQWTQENQELERQKNELVSDMLRGNEAFGPATDWATYDEVDAELKSHGKKLDVLIEGIEEERRPFRRRPR